MLVLYQKLHIWTYNRPHSKTYIPRPLLVEMLEPPQVRTIMQVCRKIYNLSYPNAQTELLIISIICVDDCIVEFVENFIELQSEASPSIRDCWTHSLILAFVSGLVDLQLCTDSLHFIDVSSVLQWTSSIVSGIWRLAVKLSSAFFQTSLIICIHILAYGWSVFRE